MPWYSSGVAFGFIYNGEEYYYIKNVQNDIVAIADKEGTVVANYYYDAWGNVTQITGNTALAQTNPLRYRSYYYDSETGLYMYPAVITILRLVGGLMQTTL